MNLSDFFLYIVIPVFSLILIFTNRYYYSKKESKKIKFNMTEDILYGNIIAPVILVAVTIGLYANILQLHFITELKWEFISIFMIVILVLLFGIGIGTHIVSVMIEKSLQDKEVNKESEKILYFFHWPFSHIMTFVPATLVLYVILIMDLVKGSPVKLEKFDLFFLTSFTVIFSALATFNFIKTHTTKIMFYTLGVLTLSIFVLLSFEKITLDKHIIAYFFTLTIMFSFLMTAIYRYIHIFSLKAHNAIQSKFPNGDPVIE